MKKNNKKGFTLVELVIVVAVMAVLVAVAIPTVKSIVGTATDATYKTNCRTIESVLKLKEAELANAGNTDALSTGEVEAAVEDGKLGITEGSFYYDTNSGIVDGTSASGKIKITFGANGDATVSTVTAGS